MTTPQAAAGYLAEYRRQMGDRKVAVHNPHSKPIEELPTIFGFNNGGSTGWLQGVLMAQDGTEFPGHICSDEGYMWGDLAIVEGYREDRHEAFRKHYPDGYKMEFVSYQDVRGHEKLMAAIKLAEERIEAESAFVEKVIQSQLPDFKEH